MFGKDKTNFPQGIPNPDKLGCGIDLSLGAYFSDQSESVEAICKLLDRPVSYADADGYEGEVVGGTASDDSRRLAWIERRSKDLGGHVDVSFRLKATIDGKPVIDWEVETYNPFFGCHVGYMDWRGDHVVTIYREKHDTILCSVSRESAVRLIAISDRWQVVDGVVFSECHLPDLIVAYSIPAVERLVPLPRSFFSAVERQSALQTWRSRGFPQNAAEFWDALRLRLFGRSSPQPEADLIIGSLAYAFWDDWPRPTSEYRRGRDERWNSPCWLPYYWLDFLGPEADSPCLQMLEQLSAMVRPQPDAEWGNLQCAVESAACCIAEQSSGILQAHRNGQLPDRAYCFFWVDWSQQEFRKTLDLFPAGFREAYTRLYPERHRWVS